MALLQRSATPVPTYGWTTDDELEYLKGIGSYHKSGEQPTVEYKVEMLRNYLKAAAQRFDWCGMDKDRILRSARRHLSKLELQIG